MKSNAFIRFITIVLLAGAFVFVKVLEKVFGRPIWIALVVLAAVVGLWLCLRNPAS